jgi:hexosaminidase
MPIRFLFILLLFFSLTQINAQDIQVVPYPTEVKLGSVFFTFSKQTVIFLQGETVKWKSALSPMQKRFSTVAGFPLDIVQQQPREQFIVVSILPDSLPSGSYNLSVQTDRINIEARDEAGLFYAMQTIIQLLPIEIESKNLVSGIQWILPGVTIKDKPAFQYRGLMIDVARHFLPISFLHKIVDLMALQKLNNLHLHLTDDQGWRIAIKKYPLLTTIGAKRDGTLIGRYPGTGSDNKPHEGYYTQEELKALVQYASARHINIIPEIDLPGHSSAAIAAYPGLSCFPEESTRLDSTMASGASLKKAGMPGGKVVQETWGVFQDVLCPTDYTFAFLKDVLNEVMDVFPSNYIHIGGDECPKESWKRSPFAQDLIRANGLHDEEGLQSFIIRTLEGYVQLRGRRIIGWDEILEGGIAPDATVMSWRGTRGGIQAAQKGHDVIMSPVDVYYLNLYQSEDPADSIAWGGLTPLKKTYDFNPVPEELLPEQRKFVRGVQANLWTEYINSTALAEFMLFPRLMAVAEAGWSTSKTDFNHFTQRMEKQLIRLEKLGVNTSSHLFELAIKSKFDASKSALTISLTGTPDSRNLFYAINGGLPKKYTESFTVGGSGKIQSSVFIGQRVTDTRTFQYAVTASTGKSLSLAIPPDPAYNRGGSQSWNNGLFGSDTRYTDAEWLGWHGKNFEGVFDFQQKETFSSVKTRFFHTPNSWVYMPKVVQLYVSDDGINFRMAVEQKVEATTLVGPQTVELKFPALSARYVKFVALNHGTIAKGNAGAGFQAWLFVDEVVVE